MNSGLYSPYGILYGEPHFIVISTKVGIHGVILVSSSVDSIEIWRYSKDMKQSVVIQLTSEVWKEGDMYVAYIPQLDISSCGTTLEEAKKNIHEATDAFIEETKRMGTLKQVLEEAGFTFDRQWKAPELISFEKMNFAL